MADAKMLSTSEVAETLGVHINTVRAMVKDKRLSAVKTKGDSGHLRFYEQEILRFLGVKEFYAEETATAIVQSNQMWMTWERIPDEISEQIEDEDELDALAILYKAISPMRIFGTHLANVSDEEYTANAKGFAHIWPREAIANLTNRLESFGKLSFLNQISLCTGKIVVHDNHKQGKQEKLSAMLMFKTKDAKTFVVDGSPQRFLAGASKGMASMTVETAIHLYRDFKELPIDSIDSIRFSSAHYMDDSEEFSEVNFEFENRGDLENNLEDKLALNDILDVEKVKVDTAKHWLENSIKIDRVSLEFINKSADLYVMTADLAKTTGLTPSKGIKSEAEVREESELLKVGLRNSLLRKEAEMVELNKLSSIYIPYKIARKWLVKVVRTKNDLYETVSLLDGLRVELNAICALNMGRN